MKLSRKFPVKIFLDIYFTEYLLVKEESHHFSSVVE